MGQWSNIAVTGATVGGVYLGLSLLRDATVPLSRFKDGIGVPAAASEAPDDGFGQLVNLGKRPKPANYTDVMIAMKAHGLAVYGRQPGTSVSANSPAATIDYKTACADYWAKTVNRLCGLDGRVVTGRRTYSDAEVDAASHAFDFWSAIGSIANPSSAAVATLSTTQVMSPVNALIPDANGPAYIPEGVSRLNNLSANAVLAGWKIHGSQMRAHMTATSTAGVDAYWDAMARLAIAVNVDRAVPDYSGELWSYILESAQELPSNVGQAVGEAAEALGRATWGFAWGLLKYPVFVAAGVGALVYFREDITRIVRG